MRLFAAFLAVLVLAACSGGVSKEGTVVIAPGSSLTAAARQLEKDGVIESADGFLRYAKLFGGSEPIKPGEYQIKQGMSDGDLLALLQSGKTFQRFVIVTPGMPSILVHERLMAATLLTGSVDVPAEGSVLPDSYAYTRGESRAAVKKRMQDAMAKALAELWKQRKPTSVVRTPQEAVILAAIIEKETARANERRMVAGVLSNRLRVGERLGADATTIYPITKGKPIGRMIRVSELRDPNPYNTRAIAGLPIGPITNPGKESIAAALDPARTRAMFYVADGTGGHAFAETYAQHNANKAKWEALRRERGEM
jgi:UPF0755 protein